MVCQQWSLSGFETTYRKHVPMVGTIFVVALVWAVVCSTSRFALADDLDYRIRRIGPEPALGYSRAVAVEGCRLLRTRQILPVNPQGQLVGENDVDQQIDQVLRLIDVVLAHHEVTAEHVIKLNVYAPHPETLASVQSAMRGKFPAKDLPAFCFVGTPLRLAGAQVAIDAVIAIPKRVGGLSSHRYAKLGGSPRAADATIMPRGDVFYISGQAVGGKDLADATDKTVKQLLETLEFLKATDVAHIKCFLSPMAEVDAVEEALQRVFLGHIPPVSYVEWESSLPIEIELIVFAPPETEDEANPESEHASVEFLTPPGMSSSPVFSRVARIRGDHRIYLSGITADTAGSGEDQVTQVFTSLQKTAQEAGTDLKQLAKATYYVTNADSSKQLGALRPKYYDPLRPPAASKAMVGHVGTPGRSLVVDMIAGPR